jgi:hypothetical protein
MAIPYFFQEFLRSFIQEISKLQFFSVCGHSEHSNAHKKMPTAALCFVFIQSYGYCKKFLQGFSEFLFKKFQNFERDIF